MNIYQKLKDIESLINYKINRIRNAAISSYNNDTFNIVEKIIKTSKEVAKLVIKKQSLLDDIKLLPEKDVELLKYRYDIYPNLPDVEIAKKLNISPRTYYRRLSKLNICEDEEEC